MPQLYEIVDATFKGTLNEGILGRIAKGIGQGVANLIGKGLKFAVSKGLSTGKQSAVKKKAETIREDIIKLISEKKTKHDDEINKLKDEKAKLSQNRAFKKNMTTFIKKKLSAESKSINNSIDNLKSTSDDDKNKVKMYWESIYAALEFDMMNELSKQNIISDDDLKVSAKGIQSEYNDTLKELLKLLNPDWEDFDADHEIDLFNKKIEKSLKSYFNGDRYLKEWDDTNEYNFFKINIKELSRSIIQYFQGNKDDIIRQKKFIKEINTGTPVKKRVTGFLRTYYENLAKIMKADKEKEKIKEPPKETTEEKIEGKEDVKREVEFDGDKVKEKEHKPEPEKKVLSEVNLKIIDGLKELLEKTTKKYENKLESFFHNKNISYEAIVKDNLANYAKFIVTNDLQEKSDLVDEVITNINGNKSIKARKLFDLLKKSLDFGFDWKKTEIEKIKETPKNESFISLKEYERYHGR